MATVVTVPMGPSTKPSTDAGGPPSGGTVTEVTVSITLGGSAANIDTDVATLITDAASFASSSAVISWKHS